ncbi:MAG: hypothetical protein LBC25_00135 [Holosporales bacterium]|nr:hypothetical protein [Holosporales bacterium]
MSTNAYRSELAKLQNELRNRENYWQNEVRNKENQWQTQLRSKDDQINVLSKSSQDNANKLRENEGMISVLLADKNKLDAANKQLENNYKNAVEESKKLLADKANLEAGLNAKLKSTMDDLTKIQKEKKDSDLAAATKISQLSSSATTLDAKYKKLEADFKAAMENHKKLQESKTQFETDANAKLLAAQKSFDQLQKEKAEEKAVSDSKITELTADIETVKSEIDSKNSEIANLQANIAEAEESRKNLEETTQAEKTAITTRFEEEKRILDERIAEIVRQLNERNVAISNLAADQEKQDASMNSVELSNMMNIDLLKTEVKELKDKLKKLIILSKQKAVERQNAEAAITLKMNNEKQAFLEILDKNREMERKHLQIIDGLTTRLREAKDRQQQFVIASKLMAAKYKEKLKASAQIIQQIKAEYAQTLDANRKAELANFFLIDSLKTKLIETHEKNKKLVTSIVKLVGVIKKNAEAVPAQPQLPDAAVEVGQQESQEVPDSTDLTSQEAETSPEAAETVAQPTNQDGTEGSDLPSQEAEDLALQDTGDLEPEWEEGGYYEGQEYQDIGEFSYRTEYDSYPEQEEFNYSMEQEPGWYPEEKVPEQGWQVFKLDELLNRQSPVYQRVPQWLEYPRPRQVQVLTPEPKSSPMTWMLPQSRRQTTLAPYAGYSQLPQDEWDHSGMEYEGMSGPPVNRRPRSAIPVDDAHRPRKGGNDSRRPVEDNEFDRGIEPYNYTLGNEKWSNSGFPHRYSRFDADSSEEELVKEGTGPKKGAWNGDYDEDWARPNTNKMIGAPDHQRILPATVELGSDNIAGPLRKHRKPNQPGDSRLNAERPAHGSARRPGRIDQNQTGISQARQTDLRDGVRSQPSPQRRQDVKNPIGREGPATPQPQLRANPQDSVPKASLSGVDPAAQQQHPNPQLSQNPVFSPPNNPGQTIPVQGGVVQPQNANPPASAVQQQSAQNGNKADEPPLLTELHRATRIETQQERDVNFAIESLINAITLLTDGDKNQATSMMNLIGSGKELPKKIAAVIDVFKEQTDPKIFEEAMKEISERYKRRLAFTNESLRYLFGENGDRLVQW